MGLLRVEGKNYIVKDGEPIIVLRHEEKTETIGCHQFDVIIGKGGAISRPIKTLDNFASDMGVLQNVLSGLVDIGVGLAVDAGKVKFPPKNLRIQLSC